MQASVKIMDIDVHMLSNDVFIEKINEYLLEEKLQVIFFASTELLDRAVADEEYRKLVDMAELFLPGEEALLSAHHADVLKAGDMVVSCRSFGMVLEKLKKEDCSVYIVSNSAKDVEVLTGYCKKINSHIPDILVVDLKTGVQEKWIMAHASLLNAKICIAIGGVANLILAQEKKTPVWVQKLHLDGLYHKLIREQSVKKGFKARIFRKKVVQYNSQIEEQKQKDDN